MRLAPPKFNLGPLLFVNVEINPNPKYQRSIARSQRLGSGTSGIPPVNRELETQPSPALPVRRQLEPDFTRFIMIIGVQQGNVRIPSSAEIDSKTKRVILG